MPIIHSVVAFVRRRWSLVWFGAIVSVVGCIMFPVCVFIELQIYTTLPMVGIFGGVALIVIGLVIVWRAPNRRERR